VFYAFSLGVGVQVQEALLIEGASRFEVLCYGVFKASVLEAASQAMNFTWMPEKSKLHFFFEDKWLNGVLLIEASVENSKDIGELISKAFSAMFQSGDCLASLCVYDGGFSDYEDIFAPSLANQTYAFCFSKDHWVVNLDADLLSSNEWALMIDLCGKRIRSFDENKTS
jgi:hypothetical protein